MNNYKSKYLEESSSTIFPLLQKSAMIFYFDGFAAGILMDSTAMPDMNDVLVGYHNHQRF